MLVKGRSEPRRYEALSLKQSFDRKRVSRRSREEAGVSMSSLQDSGIDTNREQ